eukprot:3796853-Rhodomonas_salina.1
MRRMKEHFHRIDEIGVDMLLASNGYVWLSPTPPEGERGEEEGGGDKEGEGEEATETAPWCTPLPPLASGTGAWY